MLNILLQCNSAEDKVYVPIQDNKVELFLKFIIFIIFDTNLVN